MTVVNDGVAVHVFTGDRDKGTITLAIVNFESLGRRTRLLQIADITDEFLDGLDRFMIRENNEFFKLKMDDKAKEEIRAKVLAEQKKRQEELKEMERRAEMEAMREKLEKERGTKKGLKLVKNIPTKKIFKHG